jgi:Raf kinase inhibitor-like YbhB/YbcL family protein
MNIISPAFEHNGEIPEKYTCLGPNVNPPLQFVDIPEGTKSLVLIVEDMDAAPEPWIHWLVFNIPPTTTLLAENSIPVGGTPGLCNNNTFGYEGPCPRYFKGIHHYLFRLIALDIILDLPKESDKKDVEKAMSGHVLEESQLVGICDADK